MDIKYGMSWEATKDENQCNTQVTHWFIAVLILFIILFCIAITEKIGDCCLEIQQSAQCMLPIYYNTRQFQPWFIIFQCYLMYKVFVQPWYLPQWWVAMLIPSHQVGQCCPGLGASELNKTSHMKTWGACEMVGLLGKYLHIHTQFRFFLNWWSQFQFA